MKVNGINRIGISLKQVSNFPFEKLEKLSTKKKSKKKYMNLIYLFLAKQ